MYNKDNVEHQKKVIEICESYDKGIYGRWNKITDELNSYFKESRSKEAWRGKYRYLTDDAFALNSKTATSKSRHKKRNILDKKDRLLAFLKKERTSSFLQEQLGLSDIELYGLIAKLRQEHYNIIEIPHKDKISFKIEKRVEQKFNEYNHRFCDSNVIKIAVVSDTHIGSQYQQLSALESFYDLCEKLDIKHVYHTGDISEGYYKNRPGAVYGIHAIGYQAQLDYIVNKYPKRDGITTYFITGNHDFTHMMNGGADIGRAIDEKREDLIYLGHEFAKVWLTDKVDMDIIHPRDGSSYALSYKLQKKIEQMSGGKKPRILVSGHYHKYINMFYRNVHAFYPASFQAQTPFMRGKGLSSDVGGLILKLHIKDDEIIRVTNTFVPYYNVVDNDY